MKRHKYPNSTAFLDVLMNTLLVFICLFALSFMQIKPEDEEKTIETIGEFAVVVTWPDESNDDVDTYVVDPAGNIVNFYNREAGLMHLERDDRGMLNDAMGSTRGEDIFLKKNEERVIIRGIVAGEYVVNVHMYTKRDSNISTPVKITLMKFEGADTELVSRDVSLNHSGEEKTAFRFTMSTDKSVTNVNYLPRNLTGVVWSGQRGGN